MVVADGAGRGFSILDVGRFLWCVAAFCRFRTVAFCSRESFGVGLGRVLCRVVSFCRLRPLVFCSIEFFLGLGPNGWRWVYNVGFWFEGGCCLVL